MDQDYIKEKVPLGLQLEMSMKLFEVRGFELSWEVLQRAQT